MARRTNTKRTREMANGNTQSPGFSTFGSNSQRSDLSGEFEAEDRHGQAQALNSAASGLGTQPNNGPSSQGQGQGTPLNFDDPFRPTERPGEPPTAGAPVGAGEGMGQFIQTDPVDMKLMAMYELTGDPLIKGLIRGLDG